VTSQWLLEKATLDYWSPKNADKAREFVQKYTKELADLVMAEVVSLASMVASKKAWIWTSLPLFHLFLTWICIPTFIPFISHLDLPWSSVLFSLY
jgi:hypothetical protein